MFRYNHPSYFGRGLKSDKSEIWRINPRTKLREVQKVWGDYVPDSLKRDGWKLVEKKGQKLVKQK